MPIVITGPELGELLVMDGWARGRRTRHGFSYTKQFPGEPRPRSAVVSAKRRPLPSGTLGAILSASQTGLGRAGLQELIDRASK